jgi:ribosomal protein S18 acetylase RimI-like enzyme
MQELVRWRQNRLPAATIRPADFFEDLTHDLGWFYLGFWNMEIAHILWVAEAGTPSTVSAWSPETGEVELRNIHTLAAFRRQGIFENTLAFALRDLQSEGIEAVYAHVKTSNATSRDRFLAAGFHVTQHFRIRRVFGVESTKRRPVGA